MGDGVTLKRRLSLAGFKPRIWSEYIWDWHRKDEYDGAIYLPFEETSIELGCSFSSKPAQSSASRLDIVIMALHVETVWLVAPNCKAWLTTVLPFGHVPGFHFMTIILWLPKQFYYLQNISGFRNWLSLCRQRDQMHFNEIIWCNLCQIILKSATV